MVDDGVVEGVHDATVFTSEVGRWRLKVEKQPTLAQLRERTAGAAKASKEVVAANDDERVSGKRKVRFRF
jgi:hypothetical protein